VQRIIAEVIATGQKPAAAPQMISTVLKQAGVTPRNPQYCFLPGTLVEGAILAASKMWYEGIVVEIETDDGRRLSVTVNHRILTAAGWKRAGDIEQGENLVCYGNPVEAFADQSGLPVLTSSQRWAVNDENRPARVEDVFETLFEKSPAVLHHQGPIGTLDFDGDPGLFDGKVCRVGADSVLVRSRYAKRQELVSQVNFVHRHVSAARPASVTSGLFDSTGKRPAKAALRIRKVLQNCLFLLQRNRLPPAAHFVGPSAKLNPRFFQATQKYSGGDVQLAGQLVQRLAGLITTHGVRAVKRIAWTGHVYDLQTTTGFIVSQGIISSNSEMIFRTNSMDAYNVGAWAEMSDPDVIETFPVWMYSAIVDERSRPWHAARDGLYFPASVPFTTVRGTTPRDVCNCRCTFIPVDKWQWQQLYARGVRLAA
jgi:hypothetical protein